MLCWAHARRKLHDAQRVQSLESQVALAFIARLYQVEREALNAQTGDCLANASIRQEWFEQRLQLRQTHSRPVLKQFYEWLADTQLHVLPKSPIGEAIRYVLPRWASFVRYCGDGRLPIDNNLSERSLRPCAIGRKNWLFLGNDPAGQTAAVWMSVLASAKRHEIEPWIYVRDLLENLSKAGAATDSMSASTELAPWLSDAYLANNPTAYRRRSR